MEKLVAHVVVTTTRRTLGTPRSKETVEVYEDMAVKVGDRRDTEGDDFELRIGTGGGVTDIRFQLVKQQPEPIFRPGQKLKITIEPV